MHSLHLLATKQKQCSYGCVPAISMSQKCKRIHLRHDCKQNYCWDTLFNNYSPAGNFKKKQQFWLAIITRLSLSYVIFNQKNQFNFFQTFNHETHFFFCFFARRAKKEQETALKLQQEKDYGLALRIDASKVAMQGFKLIDILNLHILFLQFWPCDVQELSDISFHKCSHPTWINITTNLILS